MEQDAVGTEGDVYPADPPDAMDEDMGDNTTPQPRHAGVRKKVLQVRPPTTSGKQRLTKNPNRILAKEKQRKALELRKAGATYRSIAEAIPYASATGARKAVLKAYKEIHQEPVLELKQLQIERYNHLLLVLWPAVNQGDLGAINTYLRTQEAINNLTGTNAATEVNVKSTNTNAVLVVDGNKDEFIAAAKKMAGIGPDGGNQSPAAITQGMSPVVMANGGVLYPPGMGGTVEEPPQVQDPDIVEGHVIEDTQDEPPPTAPPAVPTVRKFSFGVDPTVRR